MTKCDEPTRPDTRPGQEHSERQRPRRRDRITPRAVNHTTNREQRQLWKPHGVGARAPHTHAAPSQPQGDSEHSHELAWVRRLQGISRTCPPPALRASPEAVITRLAHVDCSANFPRRLPRAGEGGVQTVLTPPATCSGPGDTVAGTLPATCQQHVGGTPPATCQRRLLAWVGRSVGVEVDDLTLGLLGLGLGLRASPRRRAA